MISQKFQPDPSDLSQGTIKDLFYYQIRSLTMKSATVDQKMRSFDVQFSDAWF